VDNRAAAKRLWFKWGLIVLGWTLFALFFASESIVSRAYLGRPLKLGETLASWFICAGLWLVATPLILLLARRFPLERSVWPRNVALHFVLSFSFAFLLLALYVAAARWVGLEIASWAFLPALRNQLVQSFHAEVLTYWALLGVINALNYYRKYRERELRASQLEARLARAQLDALRMQLHPHFLFNTLNTISVLMQEDVALANRLLLRLSDLLRLALSNTNAHEVSLREELEFLGHYLEIEQTRFQDRLTVRIQVDDDAYDAQVPNLILQPLVENAIRHAVAPRATKSTIEIRAVRQNGFVELLVCDDGPGLVDNAEAPKGIGLTNTRARLHQLYGSAGSFQLLPADGGGLEVRVRIPFHTATIKQDDNSNGKDTRTDR
jgi:two-component sensor histidine kinase